MKYEEVAITMDGYCKIEKRVTKFKLLKNGKWICISGTCSHAGGQVDYPPEEPDNRIYI